MTISKDHLARAYLLRVAEPPAPALTELVQQQGPLNAAKLVRTGQVSEGVAKETSARAHLDLVEQDFAKAHACAARLIIPEDQEWPAAAFSAMAMTVARGMPTLVEPLALWARGDCNLAELTESAVAVVGARAATGYGEQVAGEVGYALAGARRTVVSGAAYGIDSAAHRGSLAGGGPTIAVLACGIDLSYPAGHTQLLNHIAKQGLVLSEYPPGTTPAKHRFLVRNRLIAALAQGTCVVEAGRRSGARNTASTAAIFGKVVMAVPGPITSAMSLGCHELLRIGEATLVGSAAEVIELTSPIGVGLDDQPSESLRATDGLGEYALRVHEALHPRSARDTEHIALESGLALPQVRAGLSELELVGLARLSDSGWLRIRPQRPAG